MSQSQQWARQGSIDSAKRGKSRADLALRLAGTALETELDILTVHCTACLKYDSCFGDLSMRRRCGPAARTAELELGTQLGNSGEVAFERVFASRRVDHSTSTSEHLCPRSCSYSSSPPT